MKEFKDGLWVKFTHDNTVWVGRTVLDSNKVKQVLCLGQCLLTGKTIEDVFFYDECKHLLRVLHFIKETKKSNKTESKQHPLVPYNNKGQLPN